MAKSVFVNIWITMVLFGSFLTACDSHTQTSRVAQQTPTTQPSNYTDSMELVRMQHNQDFKNPASSPLEKDSIATFTGLHHYAANEGWKIKSQFTLINSTEVLEMPTTTERIIKMAVYGKFDFMVNDTACTLLAYQDVSRRDGTVFIPFLDQTNGFETYGGGRYMDVLIPTTDSAYLDFNTAYNPYCAYNAAYSCPIPPLENTLPVAILAGEKQLYMH